MLVSRLKVKNFRSMKNVELKFKPLTILVGPNASGKSNILLALDWLLKKQINNKIYSVSRDHKIQHGVLEFRDYIFSRNPQKKLEMEVEFCIPKELSSYFHEFISKLSKISGTKTKFEKFIYGFAYSLPIARQPTYGSYKIYIKIDDFDVKVEQRHNGRNFIRKFSGRLGSDKVNYNAEPFLFSAECFGGSQKYQDIYNLFYDLFATFEKQILDRIFFLSSLRGRVKSDAEAIMKHDVGPEGENIIEVSSTMLASYDLDVRKTLGNKYLFWLRNFGINDFSAGLAGDKNIKATYLDASGSRLNLSLASYGNRQIASVIAQLIVTPEHSLVMIEEPEISLHPEHQALLPVLFADLIKDLKKQVIVTTHSVVMILALMDAVLGHPEISHKTLSANEIVVYHVERVNGQTMVKELELTKEGLPKKGVPSFVEAERKLFRRFIERIHK